MKQIYPTEEQEQIWFVKWLEAKQLMFTAVPHSTWTPSFQAMRKNTRMGVRKGFPDLLILVPEKGIVCVELKRQKGGKVSSEQKEWIKEINKIPCAEARVCYGATEAIAFIEEIMGVYSFD